MSDKLPDLAIDLLKYNIDVQMERGVSLRNRMFTLTGEVNLDMFHRTEACLNIFESENNKTITIKLCSEGGDIYAALAIVGRIKASPCNIRIEAYGQIMSAATAIFACGDVRVASRYTTFMFHQCAISLPDQSTKRRDVRDELLQSEHEDELFSHILAEHSSEDVNYWQELVESAQNMYMTAEQCKALGVVDKII